MSGFRSKLARLRSVGSSPEPEGAGRVGAHTKCGAGLPGERVQMPGGALRLMMRRFNTRQAHGEVPIGRALGVAASTVARLTFDPTLEGLDLSRALFLDTETTGLAGGAGTIPFLIGLGRFTDGAFEVEQLFLEQVGEERPMLEHLRSRIEEASCVITYNGKSFDWPLLRTRYVLNRVPMVKPRAHIDLLHAARRIYKSRLQRVRLVDLEEQVLDFRREGDVPGSEIPALYFAYLRGGDAGPMCGVLEHNVNDILALAAILSRLAEGYEALRLDEDARDRLGYAEVAAKVGDEERAASFASAAIAAEGDASCSLRALLLTSRLARRRGDVAGEGDALRGALVHADPTACAMVHLALAKHYEHRGHDLGAALRHARETCEAETAEGSAHRVARLERRLARTEAPSTP